MSYPSLSRTRAGEVLLVATHYESGAARWDNVADSLGGRWDGDDALVLGESGIRLRAVKDPGGRLHPSVKALPGARPQPR